MEANDLDLSAFELLSAENVLEKAICEVELLGSMSRWGGEPDDSNGNDDKLRVSSAAITAQNQTKQILAEMKNERDRRFIEGVLKSLHAEIGNKRSWTCLRKIVKQLKSESDEQCSIMEDCNNLLRVKIIDLKQKIISIEKQSDERIKQLDVEVSALKDELEDANFQQEVEIKYIEKWEESRINQGLMLAEMEERRLKEKLQSLQFQMEDEERVHIEITNYLESAIIKLEEDIESWIEEYKKQMMSYDNELKLTKEKREDQAQKLKALTDKFYDHGKKIKEYIEEKKEREREQAMKEHLNKMATKIQAWWRGVMVRRHLGPYKKKGKTKEKPKFKGKGPDKADANQEKTTGKAKGK